MSDDTFRIKREYPATGNVKRLKARRTNHGRVRLEFSDDRSHSDYTLDRGEAYRLAEYLFGHDPGARPLPVEEIPGPLAERAPDGSILVTDEGARWFINELARKLGKPVIEDLLATATAQVAQFSFGRGDEAVPMEDPCQAVWEGALDKYGNTDFTANLRPPERDPEDEDPGRPLQPVASEWVHVKLATWNEAWRSGYGHKHVKVVVTIEDRGPFD
jgi:hypothetical protein